MEINEILDDQLAQDDHIAIQSVTPSQFTILFLCSFGLYAPWWMYKVWKFFKEKDNLDIMPAGRAIFAIFFMYDLLDRIKLYAQGETKSNISYSSGGLFGWFILSNLLSRLPDPMWIASFLGVFSFYPPLKAFNSALESSNVYKLENKSGFNTRQIVLIVIGILFWALVAIGLMLPEESYGGDTF